MYSAADFHGRGARSGFIGSFGPPPSANLDATSNVNVFHEINRPTTSSSPRIRVAHPASVGLGQTHRFRTTTFHGVFRRVFGRAARANQNRFTGRVTGFTAPLVRFRVRPVGVRGSGESRFKPLVQVHRTSGVRQVAVIKVNVHTADSRGAIVDHAVLDRVHGPETRAARINGTVLRTTGAAVSFRQAAVVRRSVCRDAAVAHCGLDGDQTDFLQYSVIFATNG